MVLVHLSAGALARATELLSIRHTNGVEARNQRGVFIDNGTVSFVTAYHKGFSANYRRQRNYHDSFALMSFKLAQILTNVSDKPTLSACQTAIIYMLHWCDR